MALSGLYRKHVVVLNNGVQRNIYSLVIKNTDWIGKQSFTLVASDMSSVKNFSCKIDLKAGETIELDVRNIGWNWCMGDYALVIDEKGKEKVRWTFSPKIYSPGTCPECQGTRKCSNCSGRGRWVDRMRNYVYCPTCYGTGQCQECFVPVRGEDSDKDDVFSSVPPRPGKFHRSIPVIKAEIKKKERELEDIRRQYDRRVNPPATTIGRSISYPEIIIVKKQPGNFGSHTFWLGQRMVDLEYEIKALYEELADAEAD